MKILYLITKSNWGGAQKYVYDLATNLAKVKSDFEIEVACGGYGELYQKLKGENIKTYHISNLTRDINIFKELRVLIRLYKLLKEIKPDIIHLNSSKMGIIGAMVGRLARVKKIIFTAHGWPFREDRNYLSIILIKFFSWLTILLSDKVICVSEKDYNDVKNWWLVNKAKLIMIHNGVQVASDKLQASSSKSQETSLKMQDGDKTKALRLKTQDSSYKLQETSFRLQATSQMAQEGIRNTNQDTGQNEIVKIVSIGELTKNKGFDYGLRAISLLKDEFQDFKYTIVSFGGEERNNLLKLILDLDLDYYVDLLICDENHQNYLKEAQIYFLPSIKEGLPYVLLEAGLLSLPAVVTDTGGVKEIIKNNQTGLLVENKNIYEMKEALLKLIKDKSLRRKLGEKAKENIENNFNIKNMLENIKEIYK